MTEKQESNKTQYNLWKNTRWGKETYQEFMQWLVSLSELDYQEFQSRLLPGVSNIIGIRTPVLHKLSREIAKGQPENFIKAVWYEYYEESVLAGFVIGEVKQKQVSFQQRLEWLKILLPHIDNWTACDLTVAALKFTREYQKEMFLFLEQCLHSNQEFELRFALVMILNYYLTKDYENWIFELLAQMDSKYYYVNMAVAWCYSVCFFHFRERTMLELSNRKEKLEIFKFSFKESQGYQNAVFIYQTALSKISDSLRSTNTDKNWVKSMRLQNV